MRYTPIFGCCHPDNKHLDLPGRTPETSSDCTRAHALERGVQESRAPEAAVVGARDQPRLDDVVAEDVAAQ